MSRRVAAVKRLSVHHHSGDYNFRSFGIIECFYSFGNSAKASARGGGGAWSVLHISLLVMNRLNKTEFAIEISLM